MESIESIPHTSNRNEQAPTVAWHCHNLLRTMTVLLASMLPATATAQWGREGHQIEWKNGELHPVLVTASNVPPPSATTSSTVQRLQDSANAVRGMLASPIALERQEGRLRLTILLRSISRREYPFSPETNALLQPDSGDDAETAQSLREVRDEVSREQAHISKICIEKPSTAWDILATLSERSGKRLCTEDRELEQRIRGVALPAGTYSWAQLMEQVCTQCQCIPAFDKTDMSKIIIAGSDHHAVFRESRSLAVAIQDLSAPNPDQSSIMLDPLFYPINLSTYVPGTAYRNCDVTLMLPIHLLNKGHFQPVQYSQKIASFTTENDMLRMHVIVLAATNRTMLRAPIGEDARNESVIFYSIKHPDGSVTVHSDLCFSATDDGILSPSNNYELRAGTYASYSLEDERGKEIETLQVSNQLIKDLNENGVLCTSTLLPQQDNASFVSCSVPTSIVKLQLSFPYTDVHADDQR